jgi:hypothetical protein
MRLTWNALRFTRLAALMLALAFVLGAASVSMAQEAAPAKPNVAFVNDAAVFVFYIKPDKTADFEELMTKLKDGLAKMDAPEVKQQVAGMRLFKNPPAPNAPAVVYVLFADPVIKNIDYWFLALLYKAYPNEGQAIFQKWSDAKAATPQAYFLDLALVLKFQ